jgi:GntR family transcriptional regulator/MocR family aminotransferase
LFPRRDWLAALRHALSTATAAELGSYPDPAGPPLLRTALSEYLGRVRGAIAPPERVIACAGVAQGMGLAAAALAASGVRRIAVEDPASPGTREVLAANGLKVEPVPVDRNGIDAAALSRSGAEAVLVTPAHQYPTGVVLSPQRRTALLAWDGWILEDDYDAEFRYDRAPVSALQGLAPDRVIYVGSVSKTLSPALRLGWLVAPGGLVDDLRERKRLADLGCATLDGLALARLITTGGYDRHLRRARIAYRRRRDALAGALHPHHIAGAAAGLHLTLVLPDRDAEQRAAAGNVLVSTLSEHYLGEPTAAGLLLGYAALPEPALTAAARALTLVPSPVASS